MKKGRPSVLSWRGSGPCAQTSTPATCSPDRPGFSHRPNVRRGHATPTSIAATFILAAMMTAAVGAAALRREALGLYRALLRAANGFASYNFRRYFVERVQRGFREHRAEADPARVAALLDRGRADLAVLRRQSTISQLYSSNKLVVE
jgi:LYR motif-containing protein 4